MNAREREKLRGLVQTLQTEFAEWDTTEGQWQPPKRRATVQFRPDGQVSEREERNPNDSISRFKNAYDESGRLLESVFQLDDGPGSRTICHYDDLGRLARKVDVDPAGVERESETCRYEND